MDNRTILQVPMPKSLKDQAEAVSIDNGFSSLQELIRVLVKKFAKRELTVNIQEAGELIRLSPAAKKRYAKMTKDFKSGRNIYHAKDIDDLMHHLGS